MEEILIALNVIALERLDVGQFRLLGAAPSWFPEIYPNILSNKESISLIGCSPFLDNFLIDAEEFWQKFSTGHLKSGLWIESSSNGKEYHLEAIAIFLEKEKKKVLLIEFSRISYEEKHHLIQTGRDINLKYYQLSKEIQKKEILLHCIVHDLNAPLTSIKGALSLISLEELSEDSRELVEIGLTQVERQEKLIRDILDVFAAEVTALKNTNNSPSNAPSILVSAQKVMESLLPAFLLKQVHIELNPNINLQENWLVIGEPSHLERVLSNLLENALRYSPRNTTVTISLSIEDAYVLITIDDQGIGITEDMASNLFQKFYQTGKYKGKAGLGLYFCRMMVEQWGGTIGYSPRNEGGTRFWFRLPRVFIESN
ncbi:MAG: HAMP domain-containing histidine kinase [Acidobacteria bacterium]|nr:HAMP domain-containing histidine kinase [Acidobacteriota bacterium]